jgi:hypothetical protein
LRVVGVFLLNTPPAQPSFPANAVEYDKADHFLSAVSIHGIKLEGPFHQPLFMKRKPLRVIVSFLILTALLALSFSAGPAKTLSSSGTVNAADTAWMLTATAFVLIMTPGLAFFYGGMVNRKNVLSTMLQSFISMVVITLLWVVVGFSLAFGKSIGGLIGQSSTFFMMRNVMDGVPWSLAPTIPLALFAFFQLKFAIITPALITGAFAERIRFPAYLVFIVLFPCSFICRWPMPPGIRKAFFSGGVCSILQAALWCI